jgi:hypothetical protein
MGVATSRRHPRCAIAARFGFHVAQILRTCSSNFQGKRNFPPLVCELQGSGFEQ